MASEFFNWTFAGAPVSVDLDLRLVERLKREVLRAGDRRLSGLLLGSATADSPIRVRITGFRQAPKDNLAGIAESRGAVGYFRFRGRDAIALDDDDLRLAAASFKDPASVFLMARADDAAEPSAGLFFWDEGRIHSDFSFLEFPLCANALREAPAPSAPKRKLRWPLAAVGVLSILALVGLLVPWRSGAPPVRGRELLGLRCDIRGSVVRVGWDKSLPLIAAARSGALLIREDGRETTLPLAPDQLRTGAVFYTRLAASDAVRLRLEVVDSDSRQVTEDLIALLPSPNLSAAWRRAVPQSPPAVEPPAPKPFQPPRQETTRDAHPGLPDLPAVSLASALPPTVPIPGAAAALPPPPAPAPAAPKEAVYVPPKPVSVTRPILPPVLAAALFEKTRVQVKVSIDRAGKVVAAEPVVTDAKSRLLQPVLAAAARNWRFEPARRDGVTVPGDVVVNVDFGPGGR